MIYLTIFTATKKTASASRRCFRNVPLRGIIFTLTGVYCDK